MSQKRRRKTERRKGRPRSGAHHQHREMCDTCFENAMTPLLTAMLDVLGPDEDAMGEAVNGGIALVQDILEGVGDGHHHVTVTSALGATTATGEVRDASACFVEDREMLLVWTHLGAAEVTETSAGITLRSVTDSGVQVRGWLFDEDGEIEPLDEAAIFSAYCTDHKTGEPLAPEFGVEYCAAYPLDV